MTDLESQICKLPLRIPGETLDQRVLSALQHADDRATESSPSASPEPRLKQTSFRPRGFFSIVFSGILAALLIGIAIGNSLPSLGLRSDRTAADLSRPSASQTFSGSQDIQAAAVPHESVEQHPMIPELPARIRETLLNRTAEGSQIVETSRTAALTGALLWERENGEVFQIATHVRDRRFDMCRDCHRVGG